MGGVGVRQNASVATATTNGLVYTERKRLTTLVIVVRWAATGNHRYRGVLEPECLNQTRNCSDVASDRGIAGRFPVTVARAAVPFVAACSQRGRSGSGDR
jgi:hypothetical protein